MMDGCQSTWPRDGAHRLAFLSDNATLDARADIGILLLYLVLQFEAGQGAAAGSQS